MTDDVFDLDALIAEAEARPFRFKFAGEEYELPARVDSLALIALDDGRLGDAMRRMFGAEQWKRIEESETVFDHVSMSTILDKYFAHVGIDLGKSLASSRSSGNTGGPSKRTSKASTKLR